MSTTPPHLGVNIDHVATIRQARGTTYPAPADAVPIAEAAGADSITIHLREDRRHIQDADISAVAAVMQTHLNLEMAVTEEMLQIALAHKPSDCCLVPEKREELTTEGGLDVVANFDRVKDACARLADSGIRASLFIDPDIAQLDAAKAAGAPVVELHTGTWAESENGAELERLQNASRYGDSIGLIVHAGHGLHYENVQAIAAIPEMRELNIGHAIVARAVFVGMQQAVREMKTSIAEACGA